MTTNFENDTQTGLVSADGFINKVNSGVTALAGGGQTGATLLKHGLNVVSTVATAADSVRLPYALQVGEQVTVINSSANSMQVFGSGTDTINAVATATGVAQAAGKTATYYCTTAGSASVAGAWFRDLSA